MFIYPILGDKLDQQKYKDLTQEIQFMWNVNNGSFTSNNRGSGNHVTHSENN
jgi:hypothetical protein